MPQRPAAGPGPARVSAGQLTLGIGVGSGLVALLKAVNGADRLGSAEVAPAFFVLGALGLTTALAALLLPHDAGDELRGRRESAR
ncbi:MAG TPA: hypothetical protein VEY95_01290 [Azospirillaceae bacterium]|nr:hypothetical protein [Azospirillaceae bacterium]